MSLNDRLKQAVDKVDPDRIVAELKASVGELAREHGGRLDAAMARVEATVDDKTRGTYADKLASARRKVNDGVAKAADLSPHPTEQGDEVDRPDYRRTPPPELVEHDPIDDLPPDEQAARPEHP